MPVPVNVPLPVRDPIKKALLVGVCSKPIGTVDLQDIPGALKDVKRLRKLLINRYQYKDEDITILVNSAQDKDKLPDDPEFKLLSTKLPTKDNILKAMRDLVAGTISGDHIAFLFAGHGDQTRDTDDKNEKDEKDEFLMPSDCESVGTDHGVCTEYSHYIIDNEIREIFVDRLPKGVHCTLIFDCCHSGTACDLPEVQSPVKGNDESSGSSEDNRLLPTSGAPGFNGTETVDDNHAQVAATREGVSEKIVTSWSACLDDQLTYGGRNGGLFIKAFVKILKDLGAQGGTITHRDMLLKLRESLKETFEKGNLNLVTPRPQLGSLIPERILDMEFTF